MTFLFPDDSPRPADYSGYRGLVFDLDNTLYTNPDYAQFQEEQLIERLGRERAWGSREAHDRIAELRAKRKAAGLPPTSLGKLFAVFGIDIATSVRWREDGIEPGVWLGPDVELQRTMQLLSAQFSLALVSNNPALVARKSLSALGIAECFGIVVGLDSTLKSKPDPEPFRRAVELFGLREETCISIGDRMDVDIRPALALGMSGILVSGVEEVYRLPEVLKRTM